MQESEPVPTLAVEPPVSPVPLGDWEEGRKTQGAVEDIVSTPAIITSEVVELRTRRAVEALLENESLTSELDDTAARQLLDWGIACARQVAAATADMDDAAAEALMTPRLGALRQMMHAINHWASQPVETAVAADALALQKILQNAAIAYGADFTLPTLEQVQLILHERIQAGAQAEQRIASLHHSLEPRA